MFHECGTSGVGCRRPARRARPANGNTEWSADVTPGGGGGGGGRGSQRAADHREGVTPQSGATHLGSGGKHLQTGSTLLSASTSGDLMLISLSSRGERNVFHTLRSCHSSRSLRLETL